VDATNCSTLLSHSYNKVEGEISFSPGKRPYNPATAAGNETETAQLPSGNGGLSLVPKATGDGGSKEPHGPLTTPKPRLVTPKLQLRIPAGQIFEGRAPGLVRLFRMEDSKWTGCSVTDDCARQLLHEGLVELIFRKGKVKGIRPIPAPPREAVKVVIIRSGGVGKPYLDGATWVQPRLPDWVWREVFYAVMASVHYRHFKPWTWEEIYSAAKSIRSSDHRARPVAEEPKARRCVTPLRPPLNIAA
jgi:hypothetical protein